MKRIITALAVGAAVTTVGYASASVLPVNGGTVQAGQDTTLYCDTDGVKANWGLETDSDTVDFVRIEGIDSACGGATMFVKVNGLARHSAEVPAEGGQLTFRFTTPPSPEAIENIRIWIEG